MEQFDAIIIGAGHNGLACAAALARQKKNVLVLEAHDRIGGLSGARMFHEGYTAPGILHDTGEVRVAALDHLGTLAEGLTLDQDDHGVLVPTEDGGSFFLHASADKTCASLRAHSESDAQAYGQWDDFITRFKPFLQKMTNRAPPPLLPEGPSDLLDMGRIGLSLRMLGRADMMELVRVLPMCAADWLQEYFQNQALCAALAAPPLTGTYLGPWSAGSAALVLLRQCNLSAGVKGGPAALVTALEKSLKTAGGTLKTNARVVQIMTENERVCGVRTEDGTTYGAKTIFSGIDPRQTILGLCDAADVPLSFEDTIQCVRMRGTTAKVHLALHGLPSFSCAKDATPPHRVRIGESIDDVERAFDAVKYRAFSEKPQLDVWFPTLDQPDLAPADHHVASIIVNYAPHDLEGGWSDASKEALLEKVLDRLEAVAPNSRSLIVGSEVLSPSDLESEFGLTGGHIHHGEHALDQLLFMRPVPAAAQYQTPIDGLYFCGSGSHPGGGVTCAPGTLAAKTALENSSL